MLLYQRRNRCAAEIHERLRLGQHHRFSGDLSHPGQHLRILPVDADSMHLRQPVDHHETRIVGSIGVRFARIAQPHNQKH